MILNEQIKVGVHKLFQFLKIDSRLLETGPQTSHPVFLENNFCELLLKTVFYKKLSGSKKTLKFYRPMFKTLSDQNYLSKHYHVTRPGDASRASDGGGG
jgi:hypothetical protein